jgi:5'-nucleotidase (lipoprotein e(P4) family)
VLKLQIVYVFIDQHKYFYPCSKVSNQWISEIRKLPVQILFMKHISLILLTLCLLTSSCSQRQSSAPDSDQMVMATLWYQHSAEARALYYQAYNLAKLRVEQALDTLPEGIRLAVVADIDETILDNSPSEGKNILEGERYSPARWADWTDQRSAKALPGSLEFAQYLSRVGVDLYYISNRSIEELDATLENLQKLSFPFADPEHILLKTDQSDKTPRRQQVMENNLIILLLGDNLNDFTNVFEDRSENFGFNEVDELSDEFGKRFIVFPNPLYGSWTKPIYGSTSGMSPQEIALKRKSYIIGY